MFCVEKKVTGERDAIVWLIMLFILFFNVDSLTGVTLPVDDLTQLSVFIGQERVSTRQ